MLRLRQLRVDRGWSLDDVVEQLHRLAREAGEPVPGVDRQAVSRWERGAHRPRPYYVRLLSRLYQASPASLGLVDPSDARCTPSRSAAPSVLRNVACEYQTSGSDGIEAIRQGLVQALDEGAMAAGTLDDWERMAASYGLLTRDRPGAALITDLTADLADLRLAIDRHRSASALRRLTRVAAQMAGLMCLTFCKLDDRAAFRRWANVARVAAAEAGDTTTRSWVLAQEAHGHYYSGDLREAVEVASHAQDIVRRSPCVGAALAAALEARAQALMGNLSETHRALGRAESILARMEGDDLLTSAFGYNEAQLRFHEGNAFTHLGDIQSAYRAQEQALKLCAAGDYTDWAMIRLDRAQCLICAGRLSDAVTWTAETLTQLTADQRQGIIRRRGHEVLHVLPARDRLTPEVLELDELLIPTSDTDVMGDTP